MRSGYTLATLLVQTAVWATAAVAAEPTPQLPAAPKESFWSKLNPFKPATGMPRYSEVTTSSGAAMRTPLPAVARRYTDMEHGVFATFNRTKTTDFAGGLPAPLQRLFRGTGDLFAPVAGPQPRSRERIEIPEGATFERADLRSGPSFLPAWLRPSSAVMPRLAAPAEVVPTNGAGQVPAP